MTKPKDPIEGIKQEFAECPKAFGCLFAGLILMALVALFIHELIHYVRP